MTIDPITVGAVSNRLWSILEEQQAALVATAFSPVVRESLDLACAIFDSHGDMVGQSIGGTPGHINAMATGMHHFVREFPPETLQPGDVLVTNNPWQTAGQINDITITTPVFLDGRLIAWFASCCHSPDIGGRLLSAEAREVYEEGLHLPIMKLVSAGTLDATAEAIIRANVRTPDETMGDILAQIAGNEVATRSLLGMLGELGLGSIDPVAAEIMDRSEAALRAAIALMPDGVYQAETAADGFGTPLTLAVAVTVEGDHVAIDFAGSSPQSDHGINVVLNYTHAYASFAIKTAVAPGVPHNAGSFRPVTVTAPEGSIVNCRSPAPVAARHLIGHMLPSLIFDALRPVLPDRLMAYSADSLWLTVWAGARAERRPFVFNTFQAGGTGARATKDGVSTMGFPTGVRATPTEIIEVEAPLVQHHRELRIDSGGAGRFRGGLGQRTRVSSLT
ncbi:MAG: hydantoinase B/oxoprolinase family protein, partial [Acidimicrobiia bacterium]|nr:hydantoinase B/oxoprolinase family protein [Acidimicrobiia bacterium]